jgi:hypothetical protein
VSIQVLDGEQMRIEVLEGKLRMLLPFDHSATPHGRMTADVASSSSALGSAHNLLGLVAGAGLGLNWDGSSISTSNITNLPDSSHSTPSRS